MSKKLTEAEKVVKAAQRALKKAEKVAKKAKVEALSRVAEKALHDADRAVWEVVREADGWDGELGQMYGLCDKIRDAFAVASFGADERVKKLNKLDPDRWPLDGEYMVHAHNHTSDEDMAAAIATSIFDSGFGRGSESAYEALDKEERIRFNTYKWLAIETCAEAGQLGFDLWAQGRHDT